MDRRDGMKGLELARAFYKEYGDASLTVLKKNPYLLRFYNVPFSIYDRIANIEGSQNEERRMSSVIYESIKKAEQSPAIKTYRIS